MTSEIPEMDPIEGLLRHDSSGETNDNLRHVIQEKTLRVMRRRRWLRRGGWLAGLAACYVAGILTMWMRPASDVNRSVTIAPNPNADTQVNGAPPAPEPQNSANAQPESALALEWQALDSLKKRPDLFRLAGDKYLQDNDLESATRCYRGALEDAPDQDLKISVNDNWLFMSLKQAKQEEKRYAKLNRP
jgi:hypothetical protein